MKQTQQTIDAEVTTLRLIKPRVRRHSTFGDDNHEAINAQLDVLTNNLTLAQIEAKYGDCEYDRDAAIEAHDWRNDRIAEAPSTGWASITTEAA
jgi:hypothetical protein